ncbi:MAG TPA: DUF4180 domain-containing protein [Bacteroidales bacterium]|nr:DUF4180 domain-containing protein [Bacteroidales bacterium]
MAKSVTTHTGKNATIVDDDLFINDIQEALDLIANLGMDGCDCIIINEKNINSDFFDLRSGFAGEMLQKFSNYRFGLAVVGDFSKYHSKSLRDFIRESNRGKRIIFTSTIEEALEQL